MKIAGRICSILVELSLLMLLVLAALAPLHAAFTKHLIVTQTIDNTHGIVSGDVAALSVGRTYPLYRFNYYWKVPIGIAHIDSGDGKTAAFHVDPLKMKYDLAGTFTVHTEIPVFDNPIISAFETIVIFGMMLLYVILYVWKRRSPFLIFGEWFYALPLPRRAIWWLVNIAAGIPFAWFMANMPLRVIVYLINSTAEALYSSGVLLPLPANLIFTALLISIAAVYYCYLLWRRCSPIIDFWHLISWKGEGVIKEVLWKRGLIMWTLHLAIVYVFARTLFGFFWADIAAAQAVGSIQSLDDFFTAAQYIIWALTVVGVLLGYGYSVVSVLWGKFIRGLDFTITGWLTNAFCYPLLGIVIWSFTPSFTGTSPIITAGPLHLLMLVLSFILNFLYMLSIWNLGTMFDLMADKGVRTSFFYSSIRHPNYTLEASMFFTTELVGLSGGLQWAAFCMYFFLYWIRSEREDNFMNYSNPAYAPYRQATPYKFIPGIY